MHGEMIARSMYGDTLAPYLLPDELATITSQAPGGTTIAVTRVSRREPGPRSHSALPREDAFLFWLPLQKSSLSFCDLDGGASALHLPAGSLTLIDLNAANRVAVNGPFDSLVFYLSGALLNEIANEAQAGPFAGFARASHELLDDPVAHNLGRALLPALARPLEADAWFVSHVCWALCCHLAHQHGRFHERPPVRGGLTPRELRRAKEILQADLGKRLSLDQLARECGLSRSHFARAFRQSTGSAPHQWLMAQRVERAQALLRRSRAPLRELARACGFVDASHFSRVFRGTTGMTPSDYRRIFGV